MVMRMTLRRAMAMKMMARTMVMRMAMAGTMVMRMAMRMTRLVNSYEFWNTKELVFVGHMWPTSYEQEDHYYCACAN